MAAWFAMPPRMKVWLGVVLAVFLCSSGWSQPAAPAVQYNIKAVFLFNFAQFIEWPAEAFTSPTAPITIAVFGEDPFGRILEETVRGEVVGGRKLLMKRVSSIDEAKKAHILFVSRSEKDRVISLLAGLKNVPVLTVSETDRFCQDGGMINFFILDNKVKFEANPEAAEAGRLKLSSKLLNLAKTVKTVKTKEGK